MTIYLKTYQVFESVQEMDAHIRSHINENYYKLNDTDRTVVSLLAQYACKYPGAIHLKVETIAHSINKSDATVRRALRKLESLQVIKKISTIRRVAKGYGANILIILPFDDQSELTSREESPISVNSSAGEHFSQEETDNSLSSKKELLHNTYSNEIVPSAIPVKNFLNKNTSTFYQQFQSTIFSMLGKDQKIVSQLYGVYRGLTYRVINCFPQYKNFYEKVGYQALIISLQALKKKKIRNLTGYYVGIFEKICQRDLFEFYDEFEE
ncbi:Helix-turn-helix domain-containing protein [Psychrobacillus sp. OK028]|uniref:helix-turn-helix domain-containing protein n=1 Tax=Psychrobacillus sp. OK028 TaxID=1884359 RepID=UPI0008916D64|nr:helix-turn-helix domain-containing protein [Psychrobacillus sp. OK028]SDN12433.1 Helix-turn-helix domain-containing protein [Psychrobacillus sp. OK028]